MSDIKRVYSQPNASSLKEGEEVVYLGRSKPLARYRKEGGQVWVSYMTTNGDLFVEKDFNVQGTISQGGSGGGSGKPVVKGGLLETTVGGLGASYDAAVTMNTLTDANDIRGRVTAGLDSSGNVDRTVAINKGGTNATVSNGWLNSRVKINENGTLSYDNTTTGAVTMNTLTDGGNIRSRVTAGLDSSGDMQRVVEPEYGGTGQDFSGDTTGYLRIVNGTTTQRSYANAKTDLELDAVLNEVTNKSFAQDAAPTATAAGDVWVDTNDNNKTYVSTGTGTGNWTERTVSAAGMDAVAGVVIYSDPVTSGTSDDDERATSASTLWVQSGTTATAKISINYYHESANESMKLACHLCTADGARAASALLGVYAVTTGGSLTTGSTPNMSSAQAGPVTISTTKITFDGTIVTGALDITGLTNNVLYKVVVLLNNADASTNTLMTSPTIIVYGS